MSHQYCFPTQRPKWPHQNGLEWHIGVFILKGMIKQKLFTSGFWFWEVKHRSSKNSATNLCLSNQYFCFCDPNLPQCNNVFQLVQEPSAEVSIPCSFPRIKKCQFWDCFFFPGVQASFSPYTHWAAFGWCQSKITSHHNKMQTSCYLLSYAPSFNFFPLLLSWRIHS